MASSIEKGITITFRGETAEFDSSVNKINGELKNLKNETKLLNRELKLDPNNFNKLSKKLDTLNNQEKLLKEQLDVYNQVMAKTEIGSDAFIEAQNKARELKIEIGYLEKSIDKLGGNKITVGLNALGGKFEEIGGKVTKLGKKFSALSASASAVLGGFAKLSYDTVKYADDINTLSKQTGLGTDTLQAFGQMADLIDVDLNTLSKSAVYLTKNLTNKETLKTYKKLGVAVKDSNGDYRDTESILFDTLSALQKVEDETERSLLANKLFGKSYSELGSILNNTELDLNDISDQVKKNGFILSQDELDKLNEANDNIDTLKMALSGLGTSLVSEFSEPIAQITEGILNIANKIKEFVNSLSTEQKTQILKVLGIVASISPVLLIVGGAITKIGGALKTMGTVVKVIIPMIKGLFSLLLGNPIGLMITGIVALLSVVYLVVKNFDLIKEKVSAVWEQFKQTSFVQGIIDLFNKLKDILDTVIESLKGVFNWVTDIIGKAGELVSSGISKVIGWFSSGGFGNMGAYASGGYGTLELSTTINVNNNGANLTSYQAQQFGRQIVEYVNDKLGRRI